jgi:hypothetical protein
MRCWDAITGRTFCSTSIWIIWRRSDCLGVEMYRQSVCETKGETISGLSKRIQNAKPVASVPLLQISVPPGFQIRRISDKSRFSTLSNTQSYRLADWVKSSVWYRCPDRNDGATWWFVSIVSTRGLACPTFSRSAPRRPQYIDVVSAAQRRRFVSIFSHRRSVLTQFRPKTGLHSLI